MMPLRDLEAIYARVASGETTPYDARRLAREVQEARRMHTALREQLADVSVRGEETDDTSAIKSIVEDFEDA